MGASNAAKLAGVLGSLDISDEETATPQALSSDSGENIGAGSSGAPEGSEPKAKTDDSTGSDSGENIDNGKEAPDAEATDTDKSGEGAGETVTPDNNLSASEALIEKVTSLTSELVSAKNTLATVQAEAAILKSELETTKATASSMRSAVSELLEVYDIRLGEPTKDRTKLSADELVIEFTAATKKFRDAFPDGKVVNVEDKKEDEGLPSAHSQVASFPFSKIK